MTEAARRARHILRVAHGVFIGTFLAALLFAGGVAAGMVLHRLHELQTGGCAAIPRRPY